MAQNPDFKEFPEVEVIDQGGEQPTLARRMFGNIPGFNPIAQNNAVAPVEIFDDEGNAMPVQDDGNIRAASKPHTFA